MEEFAESQCVETRRGFRVEKSQAEELLMTSVSRESWGKVSLAEYPDSD
jgi:hypothetical protein